MAELSIPNVIECWRNWPCAPRLLDSVIVWSCALARSPAVTNAPKSTSDGTFTGRIVRWSLGRLALSSTWMSIRTVAPSQLQPRLRRKNSWRPPQNPSIWDSTPVLNATFSGSAASGDQRNRARRCWRSISVGRLRIASACSSRPAAGVPSAAMPSTNSTPQRMMIVSSPAVGSYSASKPPPALARPAPVLPGVRSLPRLMPSAAHASASASSAGVGGSWSWRARIRCGARIRPSAALPMPGWSDIRCCGATPDASARLTAALPKPAAIGPAGAAGAIDGAASRAGASCGACSCVATGSALTSQASQRGRWGARSERPDSRAARAGPTSPGSGRSASCARPRRR